MWWERRNAAEKFLYYQESLQDLKGSKASRGQGELKEGKVSSESSGVENELKIGQMKSTLGKGMMD